MDKLVRDEKGMVIVEAAYVFPIIILITVVLYFTAIYISAKANIQSSLEWTLNQLSYSLSDVSVTRTFSNRRYMQSVNGDLNNPYRYLLKQVNSEEQENYQIYEKDMAEWMFLPIRDNMKISVTEKNFIVYKEIEACAVRTFHYPINMSFIGLPSEIQVVASAKRSVDNPDELIRNMDIAFDVGAYVDEKYGETDKVKVVFDRAGSLVKKFCSRK